MIERYCLARFVAHKRRHRLVDIRARQNTRFYDRASRAIFMLL